ncbi:rho GTPase-activating protein conundrum [Drosophila teissieri]|uniref:rho GTPase-activating protein conundrum n=1 Tax=Drosophila teissieri TaxID=7243 RepID=UPI001CBA2E46|nr:rho GTPase-activating protein conundrum [Drosophila teissieri]XP_043647736.1 rho GTPase-activating protein conundrum [Drosophila teissieri]XP_043647744.1 rho GTPase-activating protein conundrum [Drosophila teissieri]XP_043647751.1 rho GTPase-activating protein conundrum [Drosophila teissieri]XP_043647759.1 rho GTPase-activating protein conundrum [Drosophila teissieri]XP_043647767.1 rho GTPase-activating protein conundrum [Drosophila teissieri]
MNNNTDLHNSVDQDYSEFLSEYLLQNNSQSIEPEANYEDGEMEAEWLVSAGYPELIKPFKQGLEVSKTDLDPILTTLSKPHAEAIVQLVRTLNKTVRGRTKSRPKRKPDIRDVFREFDERSTGTRSRSATPDSLDSLQIDQAWTNNYLPNFVNNYEKNSETGKRCVEQSEEIYLKPILRRTPSAPLKSGTCVDIFRGSHVRCDIPLYSTHGVELLGYSRISTIQLPRNRSGSDPFCSIGRSTDCQSENDTPSQKITLSEKLSASENECIRLFPMPYNILSFESICRDSSSTDSCEVLDNCDTPSTVFTDIASISETGMKRLQTILWLELATIFDRNKVSLDKRKPFKRRRKEEGNLFGVSINALIRRDQQVTGTDSSLVPLFLENLIGELLRRGSREEGLLRIGGHKQKTELLYNELESAFYHNPENVTNIFCTATVHELSSLLKRWLRELPQPLLTSELIQLFYQCHTLPSIDKMNALSILCHLLPPENRNTLRSLLSFFNYIINLKDINKMNVHNVATIIAPSLFPPRYIHPSDKNSIAEQVRMAAQCCHLTNILILRGERLFQVPNNLIMESQKTIMGKKGWHRHRNLNEITANPSGKASNVGVGHDSTVINKYSTNLKHLHPFVI